MATAKSDGKSKDVLSLFTYLSGKVGALTGQLVLMRSQLEYLPQGSTLLLKANKDNVVVVIESICLVMPF